MAQICNVAFAYQIETIGSPEELDAFVDDLPLSPNTQTGPRLPSRSRVSDNLLNMMAPPSMKR